MTSNHCKFEVAIAFNILTPTWTNELTCVLHDQNVTKSNSKTSSRACKGIPPSKVTTFHLFMVIRPTLLCCSRFLEMVTYIYFRLMANTTPNNFLFDKTLKFDKPNLSMTYQTIQANSVQNLMVHTFYWRATHQKLGKRFMIDMLCGQLIL